MEASWLNGKRLLIYCAGGQGRETLKTARAIQSAEKRWSEILFVDDGAQEGMINGVEVLHFQQYLEKAAPGDEFIIASGEPVLRRRISEKLLENGCQLAALIHPQVERSPYHQFGKGVYVAEGVVLSDNITIGDHTCVNANATVGHDVTLDRFVTVSPGAILSGHVQVREGTYIGTGAIIRDEVKIGKNSIIGMGSLVTKDIPDGVVAYGSPCRVVRENTDGIVFR